MFPVLHGDFDKRRDSGEELFGREGSFVVSPFAELGSRPSRLFWVAGAVGEVVLQVGERQTGRAWCVALGLAFYFYFFGSCLWRLPSVLACPSPLLVAFSWQHCFLPPYLVDAALFPIGGHSERVGM